MGVGAVVAGVGAAASIGSSMIASKGAKDAAKIAASTTFEHVDLDALQERASKAARENAIASLGLEKELTPDVARARGELSSQIANELGLGGQISPDVANLVARRAITGATSSGLQGAGGPITAATLGLTSMDLANQRQAKAGALLAANPLVEAGLSPGSIASAAVADINAANQFNVGKSQAMSNAAQSKASANAGILGSIGSGISGVYGAYKAKA